MIIIGEGGAHARFRGAPAMIISIHKRRLTDGYVVHSCSADYSGGNDLDDEGDDNDDKDDCRHYHRVIIVDDDDQGDDSCCPCPLTVIIASATPFC